MKNSLFADLKGNSRACVFTEPLWGIAINTVLPYASIYMMAIGLDDSEVGLVATVYMGSQVCCAFLGGPITDKLGRRKTTAAFDFIAWSVPCLVWLFASNFWYFFAAALINGTMKIVSNSWQCLLVEDAEPRQITRIQSLVVIGQQFAAFFGPVVALLISSLTLVPAMRILYASGFVIMTLKVILTYIFTRETNMGIVRLRETKGKSIFFLARGYAGVVKIIGKSKGVIFALAISVLVGIVVMVNNTFWQVIASKKLLVPLHFLPFFPILRVIITIVFLFFVVPQMTKKNLKTPLLAGFACFFAGQLILVLIPANFHFKYLLLCISLMFDGFGFGVLHMLARSLVALNVNPQERARMMAILDMIIMSIASPFGWIAGMLSGISRSFPFALNLCLLSAGFCATLFYYKNKKANPKN